MKKPNKKVNKIERAQQKKQAIEYYQKGTGLYLFRNRSVVSSLELPKISHDGKKWVKPNETWQGDSYFLQMVPKEAIIVQSLEAPKNENVELPINEAKENIMEEKLILDQPDQVTKTGKVEHAVEKELPLTETAPTTEENKEKLLTEDPLAGVTIIRD
jgi:hypothetical protein